MGIWSRENNNKLVEWKALVDTVTTVFIRSEEGLAPEKSAFKLLTVAKLRYHLKQFNEPKKNFFLMEPCTND